MKSLGLHWGLGFRVKGLGFRVQEIPGVILGSYWDNGKENGNH